MKKEHLDLVVELRHELHAHPELSSKELWTRARLQEFLTTHTGLEVIDCGPWFYAYYHAGDSRPTIAFRADFDALPVHDRIDKPYRSRFHGVAHKCGHDGHAACLAGLCLEIDESGADKNIVFIFQHAEEIGEGAKAASAVIATRNVKEIYAFHNYAGGPPFVAVTRGGAIQNCASTGMSIHLTGRLSHSSEPEHGINPAFAIAELVRKIPELAADSRWTGPLFATICNIEVGEDSFSFSPGEGVLRVNLRDERDAELSLFVDEVEKFARETAAAHGLDVRFKYRDSFPETYNHRVTADKIRRACAELGIAYAEMDEAVRGSEDFGWYTKLVPGSMFAMSGDGPATPLHSEGFDFDDKLIEPVMSIFANIAAADISEAKFEVKNVSLTPGGTAYLLITPHSAFLCDTGYSFSAADTVANIDAALRDAGAPGGRRKLDYLLLTHSHFDHAGGAPVIARAFPEAKIVASSHAAYVLARPGARKTIREMDVAAARFLGADPGDDTTGELRVDVVVNDGDVVRTEDETIRVYDTPGHTNCSVSYYFENEDLLVTSESSGFKFGDVVWPAFLTSYRDALDSTALIERLAPEHLLLPHAGLISGDEAKAYPAAMREETKRKADFVLSRHNAGMPSEKIEEEFITAYFDGVIKATGMQSRESFAVNAHELVPRLIAEQEGKWNGTR
jgi:amidohydrolase